MNAGKTTPRADAELAKATGKKFPGGNAKPDPGEQRIAFDRSAYAQLIGHAVIEPDTEVCGVLVGRVEQDSEGDWVDITNIIKGMSAKQEGTQVTFTHETWNHIHAEMDRLHGDKEILGWYHTHGGFGIFLSDMDSFIHENFFTAPHHLAYVYDPLAGTEGFFRKVDGKLKPARRYWLGGRERRIVMRTAAELAAEDGNAVPAASSSQDVTTALQRISQVLQMLAIARENDGVPVSLWLAVAAAVVMSGYAFLRPLHDTGPLSSEPRPLLVIQEDPRTRGAVGIELHAVVQAGGRMFRDEKGQTYVGIDPAQSGASLEQLLRSTQPSSQTDSHKQSVPVTRSEPGAREQMLLPPLRILLAILSLLVALVALGVWLLTRGKRRKKGLFVSTDVENTLRITTEELLDPHVDELLSRQLSFGMAPADDRVPNAKTALSYRPWFALMLAGMIGGVVGWAVIEPFFDDGLRFSGTARNVAIVDIDGVDLLSSLSVGGVDVQLTPNTAIIDDGGPVEANQLKEGCSVEIVGESFASSDAVVATKISILPLHSATDSTVSLKSLRIRSALIGLLCFPTISALVGLFIGAMDGILSRATRRAVYCGAVGLGIALGAGLVAALLGELVYGAGRGIVASMYTEAGKLTTAGLIVQMVVRGVAWALCGAAVGLGQGVALQSKKLTMNGLLGGVIGALIGGILFDPIDLMLGNAGGAEASRLIGFATIGASTGLMIGIVELMAREAWIKMLTGPITGKEFALYKQSTRIGSSPKSDIYLFKDPDVEPTHAELKVVGERFEIDDCSSPAGIFINGRRVHHVTLVSGDQIRIGKSVMQFEQKEA